MEIGKTKILALIPARSGSKSIRDKNIRMFGDKPLIAHSIRHGIQSKYVNRVIVSTDSEHYAKIAKEYGAETPFLRPPEISGDLSTDLEVFSHALKWLEKNEGYVPEICVHLRPTHPIRNVMDIDKIIEMLLGSPSADSVRSISPAIENPFKMWFMNENTRYLAPVVTCEIPEAYNQPRQRFPIVYSQNACIDVVRSRVILEMNSMSGKNILGYVMGVNFDIDTEDQWRKAEHYYLQNRFDNTDPSASTANQTRTYCFDIDGIIASIVPDLRYDLAVPIQENVRKVNQLYDTGHKIILFTARGSKSGKGWQDTTERQLAEWGVKYHQLIFGKPAADYYIDDKSIDMEEL